MSKENNTNYTPGTFSKESVDKALKNTKDPMFFMDEATRNEINDRMMEDLSPIGLKPLWLNKEARYIEIKEAIKRYNQASTKELEYHNVNFYSVKMTGNEHCRYCKKDNTAFC